MLQPQVTLTPAAEKFIRRMVRFSEHPQGGFRLTVTAADSADFDGVIEGTDGQQPTGYSVSVGGNAHLRHLITRTDPIGLETIPTPPAPAGTRDVELNKAGASIGDPSTLRGGQRAARNLREVLGRQSHVLRLRRGEFGRAFPLQP